MIGGGKIGLRDGCHQALQHLFNSDELTQLEAHQSMELFKSVTKNDTLRKRTSSLNP